MPGQIANTYICMCIKYKRIRVLIELNGAPVVIQNVAMSIAAAEK